MLHVASSGHQMLIYRNYTEESGLEIKAGDINKVSGKERQGGQAWGFLFQEEILNLQSWFKKKD